MGGFVRLLIGLLIVSGLSAGGYFLLLPSGPAWQFRTASVELMDITANIAASGTLQAEEVVDVGAQVAGRIEKFGVDPSDSTRTIDYRSQVEEGTLLAQIDDKIYRAQLKAAEADFDQAKANLERAEADIKQFDAKLQQAERDWSRAQSLWQRKSISELEYDTARSMAESARAAFAVAVAGRNQARAALAKAEAAREQALTTLEYTRITSPVKGVIIDRRVNVGQTVVASLNAPSLFLIAKDLRRLQVWAQVNEADIGQIHDKQQVKFTVDTFPGETFDGYVSQIRLNANMTQNVVTYTVVVSIDNSSGRLVPYLTANLLFEIKSRAGVKGVPNAALRWQPLLQYIHPDHREAIAQARSRRLRPGESATTLNQGTLWTEVDGFLKPVTVKTGVTDGVYTEIVSDNLPLGANVVIGVHSKSPTGEGKSKKSS